MASQKKRRAIIGVIYSVLIIGIVWQAVIVADALRPGSKFPQLRSIRVMVEGDVRQPGVYRVPEGTTQFEILQVAGVRPTTDLSGINLMSAVEENSDLRLGSRTAPVSLSQRKSVMVRLEFFYGDILLTAPDGRSLPVQEGVALNSGDRIQTEGSTQAELSIGQFSRIDIDNFSEISFDKIGVEEGGVIISELFQKVGACWYKIAYADKKEMCRIVTPYGIVTASGTGADFFIEVVADYMSVNCMDGQVIIERASGNEINNLISGQTAKVFNDGRPVQTGRLAPDMSASERFNQLTKEKKNANEKNMPFNFLFCATPSVFFLVSLQYDANVVYVVQIPAQLAIEQFAEGMATLDEAYMYGGPLFTSALVEQILNTRISKYMVFSRTTVLNTIDIVGGVSTTIDAAAALQLRKSAGKQKLSSKDLASYLSPASAGMDESQSRLYQLLKVIFDELRSKSIVLTAPMIDQIFNGVDDNMTTVEIMDNYIRFSTGGSWSFKEMKLPVKETRQKGRLRYEPDLEKCRLLIEK